MATTAKGTPYVESSDLVADYPTVSLALAEHIDDFGGKVLQVVRATDTTVRSTTSTSFVDITGLSVTITPQKSDSAILLIVNMTGGGNASTDDTRCRFAITDSSNNVIVEHEIGTLDLTGTGTRVFRTAIMFIGYATPATTSAVTYKARFRSNVATTTTNSINSLSGGAQIYAIEVSA